MHNQTHPVATLPRLEWRNLPGPQRFFVEPQTPYDLDWLGALGIPVCELQFAAHDLNPNVSEPCFIDGKITFYDPGLYMGRGGGHSVLFVCTPQTEAQKIELSFDFVGHYVTGAPPDPVLDQPDMRPVLTALMLAPRLMDLNCGPSSLLLLSVLFCMGMKSRRVYWVNTKEKHPYHQSHVTLEVYLKDKNCWQMIDVHNGFLMQPSFSSLSLLQGGYAAFEQNILKTDSKIFYNRSDHFGCDDQARIMAVRVQDVGYLSPQNPHVSESRHKGFFKFLGPSFQIHPMEKLCALAGYRETIPTRS